MSFDAAAIRGVDSRLSWNFSVEDLVAWEAEVSEALIIIGADVAAALAASPGAFDLGSAVGVAR